MTWSLHQRWPWVTCGLVAGYFTLPFWITNRVTLAGTADAFFTLLIVFLTVSTLLCAWSTTGQTRVFWLLMGIGGGMWAVNNGYWFFCEALLGKQIPDPSWFDAVLFLHVVVFIAAVALRPHRRNEGPKLQLTLNFLMLLTWWTFLYTFLLVPEGFIQVNAAVYSRNFDLLYFSENLVLLGVLGMLTWFTKGSWRKVYWSLFRATGLYTMASLLIDEGIRSGKYFSGSWYDIPFLVAICWLIQVPLMALESNPQVEEVTEENTRLLALSPRLAMVAVLSLPGLACWAVFVSQADQPVRHFRLFLTLTAIMGLGIFIFLRQFLLDRELVRLIRDSENNLQNMQRLHSQLVQKEKLAELGEMLAVAANDIDTPLRGLVDYGQTGNAKDSLSEQQQSWLTKIVQLAERMRDLVSSILSFTQQAAGEKSVIQLAVVLNRALQMQALSLQNHRIRVETSLAAELPPIVGNTTRLLECFLEIIGNAQDAMDGLGGGTLWVSASGDGNDIIVEFRDSGPGLADPKRVFDPFYTTKPIGKGTGLGLSATYGVMQDHGAQIGCHNAAQGGAVFVMRFPIARESMPQAMATAAKA